MPARRKRRSELRKAILAMVALYGGTAATGCRPPIICDPLPPPSTVPRPSGTPSVTPMICDPTPPPSLAPLRTATPMIFDPPPEPAVTPGAGATPTAPAERTFQVHSLQMAVDGNLGGAAVRGTVLDAQGRPLAGVAVAAAAGGYRLEVPTDAGGAFLLPLPAPGSYTLAVGGDEGHALALDLRAHDVATVEWVEVQPLPQALLPLAEIRAVEIVALGGLSFGARSPWPGARCRWSVSGGALAAAGEAVTWQPPAQPGRYLLQLAADWGPAGLAVASRVLAVGEDGSAVSLGV